MAVGGRSQAANQQDVDEQASLDRNLGIWNGSVPAVAHDLRSALDRLLA